MSGDEMLGNIRQQNGSADAAAGQEHSSASSSELIHNRQEGDDPAELIPRSEVGNSSCVNHSSCLEGEEETDDQQPQAAAQAQQLCGQGGHNNNNIMSLNLNQDLNYNLHQQIINQAPAPSSQTQTQTLFGFDLSLTRSPMTGYNRAGGDHIYHAADQHQPPSTNFIGVPNYNNIPFGNNNINGVVFSQFNAPPSRAQEMALFGQAAAMLPTHELYGEAQFHQQLLPPQHHQMQMTWPETMTASQQQQSEWSHHHHHALQLPTHRPPPNPAASRSPPYVASLLYDPRFEYSGLPVDPLLRMFVCNPNFANRRWN